MYVILWQLLTIINHVLVATIENLLKILLVLQCNVQYVHVVINYTLNVGKVV